MLCVAAFIVALIAIFPGPVMLAFVRIGNLL